MLKTGVTDSEKKLLKKILKLAENIVKNLWIKFHKCRSADVSFTKLLKKMLFLISGEKQYCI